MANSPPLFPILPHSSDDGEMPMALDLIAPQKSFVKSKSFEKDIVILSMTYVLAENPEFKRLTDLIVAIHDNDEEDEVISSVHYLYWSLLISSSSLPLFSRSVLVSASSLLLLARLRLEKQ
jgi:hypothetical protein